MRTSVAAWAFVLAVLSVRPADGQGHRGAPPGQLKKQSDASSSSPAPAPATASSGSTPAVGQAADPARDISIRSFGTWLDDATLAEPGSLWLTASVMRWTTPSAHGFDAPSISIAAGLGTRTQLSLTVPVSRVSFGDVESATIGDIYGGVKIQLAAPGARRVGLSLTPTLEILNSSTPRQAHLVLPASFEVGGDRTRVYGSAGWFSRGAVFAATAVERHLSDRIALTGAVLQSWATGDPAIAAELGVGRTRTDVNGMVSAFVGQSAAVFGGVSRTVSRVEFDSATFVVFGGVALQVTPGAKIPVRVPR